MSSRLANNQPLVPAAGLANYVLVLDGGTGRAVLGRGRTWARPSGPTASRCAARTRSTGRCPTGPAAPYSIYAPVGARHMYEFGTTSEQLAAIAVACRKHATMNERACLRDPITIDDVMNSRWISWPHHLLDCAYIAPGTATAYIVTSADRAYDSPKPPVWILGAGHGMSYYHVGNLCTPSPEGFDIVRTVGKMAGDQAFGEAGVSPQRHRLPPGLRQLHDHGPARHRGLRLLREGRGRPVRRGWPPRARRRVAPHTRTAACSRRASPATGRCSSCTRGSRRRAAKRASGRPRRSRWSASEAASGVGLQLRLHHPAGGVTWPSTTSRSRASPPTRRSTGRAAAGTSC